jgi:dihydropteroate synthase
MYCRFITFEINKSKLMIIKDTFFSKNRSLNCGGKLVDLSIPKVMGILNVTPDSFYDGGRYDTENKILMRIREMISEGADIIDIGGMSTRPGSKPVAEEEEISRIIPAIKVIRKYFPEVIISVDTYRANVARTVVKDYSVNIINDISGGEMDSNMYGTIADLRVPYIIMHMKGSPMIMQTKTEYGDILAEMIDYLSLRIEKLKSMGVIDLVIDPGFGFSKTIDQNFFLLKNLGTFRLFELPLMAGISRKSMIYRTLGIDSEDSLNGTTVLNTIALLNGADIIRVHDVKEAVQAVKLVEKLKTQEISG